MTTNPKPMNYVERIKQTEVSKEKKKKKLYRYQVREISGDFSDVRRNTKSMEEEEKITINRKYDMLKNLSNP